MSLGSFIYILTIYHIDSVYSHITFTIDVGPVTAKAGPDNTGVIVAVVIILLLLATGGIVTAVVIGVLFWKRYTTVWVKWVLQHGAHFRNTHTHAASKP